MRAPWSHVPWRLVQSLYSPQNPELGQLLQQLIVILLVSIIE